MMFKGLKLAITEVNFTSPGVFDLKPHHAVIMKREHELFEELKAKGDFDPLEVIPEHLNLILNGGLVRERNLILDYALTSDMASSTVAYLSAKMAKLNFITMAHGFKPKQFKDSVRFYNWSTSKLEMWFTISGNGVRPSVHTYVRMYVCNVYVSTKHTDQRVKPFFKLSALFGAWVWIIVISSLVISILIH